MPDRELVHHHGRIYDSRRWEGFEFRPDDIVISTPPKCGTTWTQMILALLILQRPRLPRPLAEISPWLDMLTRARRDVVADLEAQDHRRFIKTHTALDGLPVAPGVTYICVGRDPRDAAVSMDAHLANMDLAVVHAATEEAARIDGIDKEPERFEPPARPPDARARFWAWVDDDEPWRPTGTSLLRALRHFETFFDPPAGAEVVLLHYDDLSADLDGQMRALADRLGIEVAEERWPDLVQAATFQEMRRNAETTVPRSAGASMWRDDKAFFRRGSSGQWRQFLDAEGQARYRRRVLSLTSPEVAAWAHHEDVSAWS